MLKFLGAFLGTPKRALWTIVGIAMIVGFFRPDLIERGLIALLNAVINALNPFIVPLFALAIMALGFRILLRGVFGKKDKK